MKQKYILILILTLFLIILMSDMVTFAQRVHIIGLIDSESDERVYGNRYVKSQLSELGKNFVTLDYEVDTLIIPNAILADTAFVLDKIRNLKIENNDVIICYTAAHGYNKGRDPYPTVRFGLTNRSDINIGNLKRILEEKKPRLCILVNESCNAIYKNVSFFNRTEPRSLFNIQAVKRLFTDAKGTLLFLSCSINQKSIITEEGGVFAKAFFNTLHEQFYTDSPNWEVITQKVSRLTQRAAQDYDNFQQKPYIENSVKYLSANDTNELTEKDLTVNVTINPFKFEDFELEIKTDKGKTNLVYYKCDTLRFWVRATKPCFIRVVDIWPDNQACLLLDNYKVDTDKVGKWIEINALPDQPFFICSQPFGIDYLLSFASQKPFCPLSLKNQNGISFIEGDFKNAIECSRGRLLMGSSIVLEDRLKILTKDKLGVNCQ